MPARTVRNIPPLRVSPRIRAHEPFNPRKGGVFYYEAKSHREWPHVVKFSGGKTSGMLLFILLESGMLKRERGDVVIFNNTSAEHPKTYKFIAQCKRIVEKKYKIPFFWVEYQTYEDARQGEYVRLPSFKLVKPEPFSETEPDGYHHRGEVFEEMLSHKGYVPTFFQRTCTQSLKLENSRFFLREWLANKEQTERLGHFGNASRLDDDEMYERHERNQGGVPRGIFLAKKAFLKECAFVRESQTWSAYSKVAAPFTNQKLEGKTYGRHAHFGKGGIQYLSFVGLRSDEMHRVHKVLRRNAGGSGAEGYEGEHVYMPLANMKVTDEDVEDFWKQQSWKLELDKSANLSNCTFCFLKGVRKLKAAREAIAQEQNPEYADTPCDLRWWEAIEKKYGRDLQAEERDIKSKVPGDFIGFFGASKKLSYEKLANGKEGDAASEDIQPCDCTD